MPRIGNDWGACDPADPRNRRTRVSILIESEGERLLVDCGPDLRQQLLEAEVGEVDAVIVTHDHADHCHGIDELRPIRWARGEPVPLWARPDTLERLKARFGYIFEDRKPYVAIADGVALDSDEKAWGGGLLRFVDQPHGGISSLGMTFAHDGRKFGYAIDFHHMTEPMKTLYAGCDLLLADCVRREPHPTHVHLAAVLDYARELDVGGLLLTHLDNSMDHSQLSRELPDWAAPAYDGLEFGW